MPALAALHGHEPAKGGPTHQLTGIAFTTSIDPVPTSSVMGRNFLPEALIHPPRSPDKPKTTAFAAVSVAAATGVCYWKSHLLLK